MEKTPFRTILKVDSMIMVFTNFRSADPLHYRSAASMKYSEAEDFLSGGLAEGPRC